MCQGKNCFGCEGCEKRLLGIAMEDSQFLTNDYPTFNESYGRSTVTEYTDPVDMAPVLRVSSVVANPLIDSLVRTVEEPAKEEPKPTTSQPTSSTPVQQATGAVKNIVTTDEGKINIPVVGGIAAAVLLIISAIIFIK